MKKKHKVKKEINEKTFELNITNELLTISKSFLWYLDFSPISHLLSGKTWSHFLNQSTFFAEGLTQEEEANAGGGYDVSININNPTLADKRLLMLQYKSGEHMDYSVKARSLFKKPSAPSEHVLFKFNEAAGKTQHIILRALANTPGIKKESVMYVFPRITSKSDFHSKIGNLIWHTSFVPVLELDDQGSIKTPPCIINAGKTHNYRTSYDGIKSEVNYFLFIFFPKQLIILEILTELICIQIERFLKFLKKKAEFILERYIDLIIESLNLFVKNELEEIDQMGKSFLQKEVTSFIERVKSEYIPNKIIPIAHSRFTTIIPTEGLKLKFESKNDFSSINYQVF
ncbi:hypothetical protein M3O96_19740 [Aquiflexum sp. TKW24L]|uniref:hypothetical protein n=1 Tax=Aquiflexum sp. TKW24L TaxID=2942212 RepID=UPI0020BFD0D7|nr:hypothetical protein [Aquiflexum sp. TKW24L]MCL6261342.1 hypothetical protein [Aquiflexum sp. TKW24L]